MKARLLNEYGFDVIWEDFLTHVNEATRDLQRSDWEDRIQKRIRLNGHYHRINDDLHKMQGYCAATTGSPATDAAWSAILETRSEYHEAMINA